MLASPSPGGSTGTKCLLLNLWSYSFWVMCWDSQRTPRPVSAGALPSKRCRYSAVHITSTQSAASIRSLIHVRQPRSGQSQKRSMTGSMPQAASLCASANTQAECSSLSCA